MMRVETRGMLRRRGFGVELGRINRAVVQLSSAEQAKDEGHALARLSLANHKEE